MAHGIFEPTDADNDTCALPSAFTLPVTLTRKIVTIGKESAVSKTKSRLDWALSYARMGIHIFPARAWHGEPLVKNWHSAATTSRAKIIEWWGADEFKKADIGAVPDKSGHCVMLEVGEAGWSSYLAIENKCGGLRPEFTFDNDKGNSLYWFKQASLPSVKMDLGLFLIGDGRFVFLPPSLAYTDEEIPDECRCTPCIPR